MKKLNVNLISGSSNNKKREKDDYYATHPIAVDYLLSIEKISKNVWENANGGSHISDRLENLGYNVKRTDIINRDGKSELFDFLKFDNIFDDVFQGDIITNPPFKFLKEWVNISHIACTGKVILILPLSCLGVLSNANSVFSKYKLKKIITFSRRLECGENGQFGKGAAMLYGWFIFDRYFEGNTTFNLMSDYKNDEIKCILR